jgi:hypothetical protein
MAPQLTLYGEAEFSWLYAPRQRRATFLLIMVGVSLATSVAAAGESPQPQFHFGKRL